LQENIITERNENSLADFYHTNTKLNKWNARDYGIKIQSFSRSPYLRFLNSPFKTYPWAKRVKLPLSTKKKGVVLEDAITTRRSVRKFSRGHITIPQLSYILQFSSGITYSEVDSEGKMNSLRAYPSGGALYPLEIYVLAFKVKGLHTGIYHYSSIDHYLEEIGPNVGRKRLGEIVFADGMEKDTSVALVLASVFHRTMIKYGDRGYRLILLETGHLGQNILLTAVSQGLAVCPIAGFLDDDLNNSLGLDGVEESVQYVFLLGKDVMKK
jgi:SagB-type dehydrogenase family enzyme